MNDGSKSRPRLWPTLYLNGEFRRSRAARGSRLTSGCGGGPNGRASCGAGLRGCPLRPPRRQRCTVKPGGGETTSSRKSLTVQRVLFSPFFKAARAKVTNATNTVTLRLLRRVLFDGWVCYKGVLLRLRLTPLSGCLQLPTFAFAVYLSGIFRLASRRAQDYFKHEPF